MLEFIRILLSKSSKWLFGAKAEDRADFAAVTDVSIELIEAMQKTLTASQKRLDEVEDRLDRNRVWKEQAVDRMDKLEEGERACQENLSEEKHKNSILEKTLGKISVELTDIKTTYKLIDDAGILLTKDNIDILKKIINK